MELQGKTALVLGAAKGIGKAIGFALAAEGATVILTYHDWPEDAAAMRMELAGLAGNHLAVQVDLRDTRAVEKLVREIQQQFGTLHILINNIERGGMPIIHGSYDRPQNSNQWDLEMATTLKAKWLVFHHTLPLLKSSGQGVAIY